jgi:hypothetical protein
VVAHLVADDGVKLCIDEVGITDALGRVLSEPAGSGAVEPVGFVRPVLLLAGGAGQSFAISAPVSKLSLLLRSRTGDGLTGASAP